MKLAVLFILQAGASGAGVPLTEANHGRVIVGQGEATYSPELCSRTVNRLKLEPIKD